MENKCKHKKVAYILIDNMYIEQYCEECSISLNTKAVEIDLEKIYNESEG